MTVLGIYYKIQSFFFIPLLGFQQVLLPLISYNYGAGKISRTKDILKFASIVSCCIMTVATMIFCLSAPFDSNFLHQSCTVKHWQLCAACYLDQLYFCRTYYCYYFISAGNCPYAGKHLYHCAAAGVFAGAIGMGASFLGT